MKYLIKPTTAFKKSFRLMIKRGYDKEKLKVVLDILTEGEKLPQKYLDHELKGKFAGYRECHIEPDWLLVYKYFDDVLVLSLTDTGTHADLFKM